MQQEQEPRYAGEFVLKHNCFYFDPDTGQRHIGGDVVFLDRHEAQRLRSVFVPVDSPEAQHLKAKTEKERAELRAQELEAEARRLRAEASDPIYGEEDPGAPLAENEELDPIAGHTRPLVDDER